MKFGKVRFYADENIEAYLVDYIRENGYKVEYANELGLHPRDDRFHLQEAKRRKSILLTRDEHFLNHHRFPFSHLKDTAIVVLKTENRTGDLNFGYTLVSLFNEIGTSGNKNLFGLKIELKGPRLIFHANIKGKIRFDEIDITKKNYAKALFQD